MQSNFSKLKNDILGKNYSLSIAFVSEKKSQEINKKYRKKDKPTNILSFSLRKNEGELVLCRTVIRREVKERNKSPHRRSAGEAETSKEWLGFLVIHGMLHLKGLEHGKKMEELENKYLSRTKF
ncbi:rRNA maturation RNase YbeY [Candidatus Nomurabacteria bacterium]|nr:rRNA maturation RNase YbeY [Candidatus Nomurabacteria bacterium]